MTEGYCGNCGARLGEISAATKVCMRCGTHQVPVNCRWCGGTHTTRQEMRECDGARGEPQPVAPPPPPDKARRVAPAEWFAGWFPWPAS